jgi:hypothetical protein
MPFIAECMFCRGKVRLPDHAVGMSITCPRCGCSFTVVPREDNPAEASVPAVPQPAALVVPAPAFSGCLPAAQRLPAVPAAAAAADPATAPAGRQLPLLGVVSILLASIALALLSLPVLRPFTLGLGGLALAAGVLGLVQGGEGQRGRVLFPAAGAVLSVPVLVIASFWPGLLSPLPPAEYIAPPSGPTGPLAVPLAGEGAEPAPDWVDASKHYAQIGDLRVRVMQVRRGPAASTDEPRPPGTEECLHIALRVYNAGTSRRLEYRGWGLPADPGGPAVVLLDDRGQTCRLRSLGPGGEAAGQVRSASIAPLRPIDDVLLFDLPAANVEFLRLELPAAAVGEAGTLRLQLPRSLFVGF